MKLKFNSYARSYRTTTGLGGQFKWAGRRYDRCRKRRYTKYGGVRRNVRAHYTGRRGSERVYSDRMETWLQEGTIEQNPSL